MHCICSAWCLQRPTPLPLVSRLPLFCPSASVSPSSSLREVDDDQSQDLFVPHATQLAKTGMHGHATLLRQSISPVLAS
uniref:Uncharacterized protein n=1 Tax=Zea mays TaxID=4577 RepID=A0A804RFW7_MAIZE